MLAALMMRLMDASDTGTRENSSFAAFSSLSLFSCGRLKKVVVGIFPSPKQAYDNLSSHMIHDRLSYVKKILWFQIYLSETALNAYGVGENAGKKARSIV
jgi:hypothetical protein